MFKSFYLFIYLFYLRFPFHEPVLFLFIRILFFGLLSLSPVIGIWSSTRWSSCSIPLTLWTFTLESSFHSSSFYLISISSSITPRRTSSSRFAVEMSFTGCWPCRPTTWGLDQQSLQSDPQIHPAVNLFTLFSTLISWTCTRREGCAILSRIRSLGFCGWFSLTISLFSILNESPIWFTYKEV